MQIGKVWKHLGHCYQTVLFDLNVFPLYGDYVTELFSYITIYDFLTCL